MPNADVLPTRGARLRQWLRRELLPLAVMLLLLSVARSSFANHYQVPSGSMQPTLMPGDRVVVDMCSYGLRLPFTNHLLLRGEQPARGSVVVFDSPADGTRLIKRVVAVGGDEVALHEGHLSINGRPLAIDANQESFDGLRAQLDLRDGGGPDIAGMTVPAGQLLMLGDHRGNSLDGRYFGLVESDRVYGRALGVYYRRGEGLQWTRL
ncbi:MAG TPA: signal peptidase I [Stenotrophomonas sp.]|jgi:signal peptidase I